MNYTLQDLSSIKDLMGEAFPHLVQTYVKNMKLYTQNIAQGFEAQDAEMIKNSAHPLKSSSRNLCNTLLADVAEALEDKSKQIMDGELAFADIAADVEKIPSLADASEDAFREYL